MMNRNIVAAKPSLAAPGDGLVILKDACKIFSVSFYEARFLPQSILLP
jgi:hypothetical protein